jgi:hypothetical protein
MLRVLADAYRVAPSQYTTTETRWHVAEDVKPKNRLRRFSDELCNHSRAKTLSLIGDFLVHLKRSGHQGGIIDIGKVHFRLVEATAPFWRCSHCGRVHLHKGAKLCTRCYAPLPETSSGNAGELQTQNYLGKRISYASRISRMRSEELTGMTGNPAARLRRFKSILIADDDDILPKGWRTSNLILSWIEPPERWMYSLLPPRWKWGLILAIYAQFFRLTCRRNVLITSNA